MREIKQKLKANKTSYKLGHKGFVGENNSLWKGENAGYGAKHDWIKRWYGNPEICENCGTTTAPKYDWANISGKYLRDRKDWKRLCRSCHHLMDDRGRKTWATITKKSGRQCLVCRVITVSKHQLCPIHLKEYFSKRRSDANFTFQGMG